MIKLFTDPTTTVFDSNGDKVLLPTFANVHKGDNDEFYLELELPLEYLNYITSGAIIVCNTPQGDQPFRVWNVEKTKRKIKVKAWHVYYDAQNLLIEDSYVVDQNCNAALDHLNSAATPSSPFSTLSDVGTVNSFRCVRKSLAEAIETVIERWGGHLVRDGFDIEIRTEIGEDRGVTIRYAKNLRDISVEESWDDVVTKLLPVGYDGLTLPEVFVESDIQYPTPFCKTVTFDQNIEQDAFTDEDGNFDEAAYQAALVADLRQQAQNYVDVYSTPRVNYTLAANVENVSDVGDTIEVIDERLGVNIMTNVIAFDYDPIADRYTQIEFGNFRKQLNGLMATISSGVRTAAEESAQVVKATLSKELDEATAAIWNALGNSYVIYDGDKILVVDSLPAEEAENVMVINSGGIGFSQSGIAGPFTSAWTIDGTLNMQNINVINLTADLIKGGTLRLGTADNVAGLLELYDENNNLIGQMDKNGLKMYGADGSYVLMNNSVGFAGFDAAGNKIYWVSEDEFHMEKCVVENEITLCDKMRFIPITLYEQDGTTIRNDGIGLVSTLGG